MSPPCQRRGKAHGSDRKTSPYTSGCNQTESWMWVSTAQEWPSPLSCRVCWNSKSMRRLILLPLKVPWGHTHSQKERLLQTENNWLRKKHLSLFLIIWMNVCVCLPLGMCPLVQVPTEVRRGLQNPGSWRYRWLCAFAGGAGNWGLVLECLTSVLNFWVISPAARLLFRVEAFG